jgi:hypothetical protein
MSNTDTLRDCIEALFDVMVEQLSVLSEAGMMDADTRERLRRLSAQCQGIHREFVDAWHTPARERDDGAAE